MYLYAVIAYLLALAGLGILQTRRVQTGDDFLVAGRTLPWHVLVFTLLATWIGSGSLFGGAGLGYRAGFPAFLQQRRQICQNVFIRKPWKPRIVEHDQVVGARARFEIY